MKKMGTGHIIIGVVVLIAVLIGGYFLFSSYGSIQDIEEIKNDDNVDSIVSARGTVTNTVKIGGLSGYTLIDETGSIGVSTKNLPNDGDTVTARGKLKKGFLIGYYIDVDYKDTED